ncbi:MAG: sulfite exporter TauE/SafE family protein [Eubacteriales bacterium]
MIIYLLVALFSTIVGAAAGLGGGVIIKPALDMLGDYNIVTVSVLSSATVLGMAVTATARQIHKGFKITNSMVVITTGAVFGGILGSVVFALIKARIESDAVTIMQSGILIALLILCLLYTKLPRFHIKSAIGQIFAGLLLGMLSSFLGIGGGPINIAILYILLGFEIRDSAKVSVLIILFAQTAGLMVKALNGLLYQVEDFSMLFVMIPAAIAGGLIGSSLNIRLPEKVLAFIYKSTVILVILICIYNISVLA